jgi:hypothetical protein
MPKIANIRFIRDHDAISSGAKMYKSLPINENSGKSLLSSDESPGSSCA